MQGTREQMAYELLPLRSPHKHLRPEPPRGDCSHCSPSSSSSSLVSSALGTSWREGHGVRTMMLYLFISTWSQTRPQRCWQLAASLPLVPLAGKCWQLSPQFCTQKKPSFAPQNPTGKGNPSGWPNGTATSALLLSVLIKPSPLCLIIRIALASPPLRDSPGAPGVDLKHEITGAAFVRREALL